MVGWLEGMEGVSCTQDAYATRPLLASGLCCSFICVWDPRLVELPPDLKITHCRGAGGWGSLTSELSLTLFFNPVNS